MFLCGGLVFSLRWNILPGGKNVNISRGKNGGNVAESNGFSLRMRQLPKPEYKLMKALVKRYALKDDSELFQIALVLLYEVSQYQGSTPASSIGGIPMGERWITQVIDSTRSLSDKDRTYSS